MQDSLPLAKMPVWTMSVDAGADGVESEALALAFLLFREVFVGDASAAGAAAASLGAAASAGLDFFEDFFVSN